MTDTVEKVFTPTKDWKPIPRVSRVIPFGYVQDPDDPNWLLPVVFELEALEKAREYVKRFSYRAVADWLTSITGRKFSHVGLKKRLDVERTRQKRAATLKYWSRRLEETQEKIRKIEEGSTGAAKPND